MRVYRSDEFMNKSKGIHIVKCSPSKEDNAFLHTHEFIEIVYITSGKMTQLINGNKYEVKRGDLLFMNYGCTHRFYSDTDYTYVNILFAPELFDGTIVTSYNIFSILALTMFNDMREESDFGKISFTGSERTDIEHIILAMLDEYERQQSSWELMLGNYLNTLIIKIIRKNEQNLKYINSDEIWDELTKYIDENLGSKNTLSDLAQKCFYNPSYFSRLFKERFGVTLTEYISRKKLERAIELLSNTNTSLSDIAYSLGFSDVKGLYRLFAAYSDKTPTDYRK